MVVRGLGVDAYGLYLLVMGIVGYLASLNFNVGRAITKYVSAYQANGQIELISETISSTLMLYVLIGILSTAGLVLSVHWLVKDVLHVAPESQATARLGLYLASAGLLFTLMSQVFSAVPQAMQRFDLYGYITAGNGVVSMAGTGVLVWSGHGVISVIALNVLLSIVVCLVYAVMARRLLPEARFTWHVQRNLVWQVIRFGGAVTAYQILGNLLVLFERVWLTRSLGVTAVTFYSVPMTIAIYVHGFISSLTLVVFPLASAASAKQDFTRLYAIYARAFKYICALVVFLVVTLVVGNQQFLSAWMGVDFAHESGVALAIHAVSFGILALLIVPWQIADGLGFPGANALVSVLWLVIDIPLAILLTPRFGIVGVACARLVAMVLLVPAYILYLERRVFGHWLARLWRRLILSLATAGSLVTIVQIILFRGLPSGWLWLFASVGLTSLLNAFILWIIGYLDQDEREWIRQFVSRAVALLPV